MASTSQDLASCGGKRRVFPPSHYTADNTGVIEEENRLSKPNVWQQCCILAKPWAPVLQPGTRGSPTPVGISTKQTAERGSGLERDFSWARLHLTHRHTHSKPTCTIHVTWGRSRPRAATSFNISKEITLVKTLGRYQQSKPSSGMAIIPGNNCLCRQEFFVPSLGRHGLKVRDNVEGLKHKEYC